MMFMLAKRSLSFTVVLLALGCSGGNGDGVGAGDDTDDALIVPEGLSVAALSGGNGVLNLKGLTLRKGPSSTELYAALRNDGDVPACHAAFSVELFDKSEQSLAAGINGLLTSHFYRLTDGSGTVAACVGPGDVTMAAVLDLPADLPIDDVGFAIYRCPYFALDVVPIDGLAISSVTSVSRGTATAFAGTFVNGLDVAVKNPSATVFPTNRVGRPLGVATASGTDEIPPGGSWSFETDTVDAPGAFHSAYPAAALSKE